LARMKNAFILEDSWSKFINSYTEFCVHYFLLCCFFSLLLQHQHRTTKQSNSVCSSHQQSHHIMDTYYSADCNVTTALHIQVPPKKCIHTLTKKNSTLYNRLLYIYNIFPSAQQYMYLLQYNIYSYSSYMFRLL